MDKSHSPRHTQQASVACRPQTGHLETVEEVAIMLTILSSWRRLVHCMPLATFAATLAISLLSVTPAMAQQAQTVTVVLTELQFDPKTITLTVGQPVQLNIQNNGLADHNLASRH